MVGVADSPDHRSEGVVMLFATFLRGAAPGLQPMMVSQDGPLW